MVKLGNFRNLTSTVILYNLPSPQVATASQCSVPSKISARSLCYTEKASPTRHRPERQHNARSNRRKQCSPNETKPYSKPTLPRRFLCIEWRSANNAVAHVLATAEVVHRFPTSSSVHNLSSTEPSVTQHLPTRSALLLAVGTFVALSFEAMPGLCCFLRVTHACVAVTCLADTTWGLFG